MKEHPILFSTDMVKANLADRKTMTRRIMKPQPNIDKQTGDCLYVSVRGDEEVFPLEDWKMVELAYYKYKVGDLLWVRESWRYAGGFTEKPDIEVLDVDDIVYKADEEWNGPWKPSIFMFKQFARIWLEITNIKIERVQDISWDDAVKEGCPGYRPTQDEPTDQFKRLWESINGKESWDANPFVYCIEYKIISKTGKP